MIELLSKTENDNWSNIGVYPTPKSLVEEFSDFAFNNFNSLNKRKDTIDILDMFCGDGRLGIAIEERMKVEHPNLHVTFIEVMNEYVSRITKKDNYTISNTNVFNFTSENKFDLIVSNPPYLVLNSKTAGDLGIDWIMARNNSKNLYALSILKGLDLCKDGGVLCVIAPFGYLRGYFSENFKSSLEERCERIVVKAQKKRSLFEGVNQDVGFQFFVKKNSHSKNTIWEFGYNGHKIEKIKKPNFPSIQIAEPSIGYNKSANVRVGPIVWNRSKKSLKRFSNGKRTKIIYGSNIKDNNEFDFNIKKLEGRQFIENKAIISSDIVNTPAIVIRRTMRGNPGKWILDSAVLYPNENEKFTAENHTILIELSGFKNTKLECLRETLNSKIIEYYRISGSPTISTKIVNLIVQNSLNSDKI